VAAFDLKDGKEIWRTARAEIPAWGSPTLVQGNGRTEVVTNATKAIRGYDADTGKELWKLSPNSEVTCTTPVSAFGLIFVTAGYPPVQPIYAIKIGSAGDLTLKTARTQAMPSPGARRSAVCICRRPSCTGTTSTWSITTA